MAGLNIVSSPSNENYNGKVTWFVILSSMMAAMGGALFGYDIGISGGVTSMEPFLKKFFPKVYMKMIGDTKVSNYCKFNSELLTSFTSSLYVAGLFASFCASYITRVFGRKPSILLGGASFLVGSVIGGAAQDIYMLILGRLLLGVGVGFANQSVPLYLSEMALPKYRGAFNNSFQLSISVGVLTANLINFGTQKIKGGWGWRISLASAGLPAFILTLGAILLPDTPNSLIQRSTTTNDFLNKAKIVLQRVRGTKDVELEMNDLVSACNSNNIVQPGENISQYKRILQRKCRPQLIMAILIPFFQQVTGINVIAFYAPLLFRTIGLGESASLLSAVLTGFIGMVATFVSMLIVDRFGRRALFIFGGALMFVCQICIGVIMAVYLGDHGGISKGYAYIVLVLICLYVVGFGLSWGPLGWLVPSEIFQLEIRSAGQSITVAVSFLFTFVIAQTFLEMLCCFKAGIFLFFAGWVLIMTAFVYWFLPETRNIPLEKMNQIWIQHWFWSRIVA